MVLLRHYTSSDLGVKTLFIEPGSPWENGYNESFNGTLRNELLKREIFYAIPSYGLSGLIAFGTIVSPQSSELVHPSTPDLMSYCRPKWISDYHFANALRFRLFDERPPLVAAMSLLLWGGLDAEGEPFLNPAFVVDAPPALPDSAGEHRIAGRTASGDELFALSFTMPEVVDGDGSSSFAFVLPAQPGWASNLATLTLSGPGGSVTLDSDTDLPMTILLNPSTGQVRGILQDLPQAGRSGPRPSSGFRQS